MPNPRRRRSLLAVLVLVSLLLLTLDFRQGQDGPLAALQRGVLVVFAPVQEALAAVVRPIRGFVSSIGELGELRDQNARLELENQALREQAVTVAELRQENEELRRLLRVQERLGFTTTGAQVIAQPPGAFDWSVLIDIGARQGVAAGMAVINADGLVGRVTEVSAGNARVELLISPSARYVVRLTEGRQEGLLSGRGNRPLDVEVLDPDAELEVGHEVVTRAFEATTIPDGLAVGVVEEVPEGPRGLQRVIRVRPHVDFRRLGFVQVILDAPVVPGDIEPGQVIPPGEQPRPRISPTATPGPPPTSDGTPTAPTTPTTGATG